ncbi:hypothetical protein [Cypionkella psychrotolerans]|uniref:hypothetical protein n=1 Tax=Cypionkella psychrotolerans TaxID=1678131 RepID=UPI0006B5E151|nr:hypothetical protein [Cypionkella psychrotolerans]
MSSIGCYKCAIGYVIKQACGFDHCNCIARGEPFCEECLGELRSDFAYAFELAEAPYQKLAEARARSFGLVGQTRENCVWFTQDINKAAAELFSQAQLDPVCFDAALWFVSDRVRNGEIVPEVLREWASKAILGHAKRPKAKGKYAGATYTRDRLIYLLIRELIDDLKLNATSGDRDEGKSACHAVAEAFQVLRLQPDSYESIRRIWLNRHKLSAFSSPMRV